MSKVLVVEDDKDLALITKINLENAGYEVMNAYTCGEALEAMKMEVYDTLILDMMLPDSSGNELCKIIREEYTISIIFVSCLDDRETMIKALSNCGDDYITKPVDYDELIARIEANIRRVNIDIKSTKNTNVKKFKQFIIDYAHHTVKWTGLAGVENKNVDLSPTEYELFGIYY